MVFESFSRPEEWDLVNFRLKNELGIQNQIRSYINPFLATHDLLISLAQLYAHKRSIAWVSGVSPLFENSQPYFVRESYQIQNVKMADIQKATDGGQSIVDGLNKDTLFLIFFKNHALTGEVYPHEQIETWASAKKIFFVLISHEFSADLKLLPSSYSIQVPHRDLSVAFLPERAKLYSAVGAYQNIQWNDTWSTFLKRTNYQFESEIRTWENSLSQTKWPYQAQRIWNRSLLIFDTLHGDVVAERLKEKGFHNVKSYSDCVSNSPKSIRSWLQPEVSDDLLRGLISLSFNDPKDIPSKDTIDDVVGSIKAESEWSF
ncbi:MAG: hypothetical protein JNM24_10455 [Bdellovibrionaceae bacterium]|nr:hypothetical protein [Pseudobdellovibrionaceae bacterium]